MSSTNVNDFKAKLPQLIRKLKVKDYQVSGNCVATFIASAILNGVRLPNLQQFLRSEGWIISPEYLLTEKCLKAVADEIEKDPSLLDLIDKIYDEEDGKFFARDLDSFIEKHGYYTSDMTMYTIKYKLESGFMTDGTILAFNIDSDISYYLKTIYRPSLEGR